MLKTTFPFKMKYPDGRVHPIYHLNALIAVFLFFVLLSLTHIPARPHKPFNPLITSPIFIQFQGNTTASRAPHQELVLLLLLATSSSAPASSTQCASPAVTHHCVMDHARRNDPNCLLPLPWPHLSSLGFLSTSSYYCPLPCADRPSHTELRFTLEMFCCRQAGRHEPKLYKLRHAYFEMYIL